MEKLVRTTLLSSSIISDRMFNSSKKKEAIRTRSRFYFVFTKLDDEFDFNLGYQYSDGALSFFSTAQRGATFKPPWGTPTSCQMKAYKNDEGCLVDHFRFTVRKGESRNIKANLFNFSLLVKMILPENALH